MSDTSVEQHLNESARVNPDYRGLVLRIREIIRAVAPNASESVKDGGIVFAAPVQFRGVIDNARIVTPDGVIDTGSLEREAGDADRAAPVALDALLGRVIEGTAFSSTRSGSR